MRDTERAAQDEQRVGIVDLIAEALALRALADTRKIFQDLQRRNAAERDRGQEEGIAFEEIALRARLLRGV